MRARWLALVALPLLAAADWFPIELIADPAARSVELSSRPAACYAMTVTGACDTKPPAESGRSNVVCRPAGPTTLHWQAPTKCADDTFPVVVSLWTIYTDALPPQPRPAPPTLVELFAVPTVVDYVRDAFTDTNGVDIDAHAPDYDVVGGGWSHYQITGSPTAETSTASVANAVEIQSNRLEIDTSSHLALIDVGQTDYVMEFDWDVSATSGQRLKIPIRWVDASNMYWWNLREPNDDYSFYQVVAGVQSTIGAGSVAYTLNTSTVYRVKIVVSGMTTELWIDGSLVTSRTMTTHAGGTHVSLGSAGITTPVRFDNLRIWDGRTSMALRPRTRQVAQLLLH